jgi:hypothetical protein
MLLGLTILLVLLAWMLGNTVTAYRLQLSRSWNPLAMATCSTRTSLASEFHVLGKLLRYYQWYPLLRRIELQPAFAARTPQAGVAELQEFSTSPLSDAETRRRNWHSGWKHSIATDT